MTPQPSSSASPTAPAAGHGPYPVVIAGGGPIGLGVALELALHGVRPLVLEQRPRERVHHARTNLANTRSMEHLRRWGVADRLRGNDPVDAACPRSVTWTTSLTGPVVVDLANVFDFGRLPFTSERAEWVPHQAIERTFREVTDDHADIEVRYGTSVDAVRQDDSGTTVTCTGPDGVTYDIEAAYCVAADGSRSALRRALGIRMEGQPDLVEASLWHIHAPGLAERSSVGRSSFFFFINEHRDAAMLIAQDDEDHYLFGMLPTSEGYDAGSWEDARELLYRNVGFAFPVEAVDGGRVRVHSLLAPRFREGRVLLAGDAAHLVSPMGGFGMNLGIGDSVDLGWKLAAVLNGWGTDALLDSYGDERRQVISWIQRECVENTAVLAPQLVEDGIAEEGTTGDTVRARVGARIVTEKTREFASFGAQFGVHCQGSPVIVADGTEAPTLDMAQYEPSASPGCRAPHLWLPGSDTAGGDDVSLYDLFGPQFTLLVTAADADPAPLREAAAARGVPLTVLAPEGTAREELAALYGARMALIRPDQLVAWRGDDTPVDALAVIDTVRGAGGDGA